MQQKYARVKEIKAQTDVLFTQLSEGEYRSLDIWANNLAHLRMKYCSFAPYTSDISFMNWLNQHDAVMVAEIVMTGRGLLALQNFFKIASAQP